MAFQLSWTIEGEQQLARNLRQIQTKLTDFQVPFETAARNLKKIYSKDVFDSEGGVINEKWKRLSPYTVAQKAKQGYSTDTLVRTGAMKKSFVTMVSSDQAVITNEAEYFKYHQSNKPRRKLPRRVMMKLAENQKQMVVKIFQNHIRKSIS